jgi:hypothetical protein
MAGPDATIAAGTSYVYGGSFADGDMDSWSATVDYGDGSGAQPLTLNPDKSFVLSHPYASPGSYTVTVQVSDGTHTGSDTVSMTVTDPSWLVRGAGAMYALTGPPASPALHVTAGAVSLTASRQFSDIAIDAGARLDMANHEAAIQYTTLSPLGTWDGSFYTQLTGLIASGRLMTSLANAQTALGILDEAANQQVRVKYTYAGDANLDGKVNIDDYTSIDQGIAAQTSGWSNGDFNYDGKVNIDDYVLIDSNIVAQGAPFNSSSTAIDHEDLSDVIFSSDDQII